MGWTFGCESFEEALREAEEVAPGYRVTKRHTVRVERGVSQHWTVVVGPEFPRGLICLAIIEKARGVWGYKLMDESMGPCVYGVPVEWLDEVPPVEGSYSAGWREKVRDRNKQRGN